MEFTSNPLQWGSSRKHTGDFEQHYQGYIVKDVTASFYGVRLLKAVQSYNADHI
jgi:hypothetical protein